MVSVQFVIVIIFNLLFSPLFVAVWQDFEIDADIVFDFLATDTEGGSLTLCGDNHDGTSIMHEVSNIVSQYPALRRPKDISNTLLLHPDGEQTLTISVKFSVRGTNIDEMTFQKFLKTKLQENRAATPSCFTFQSIALVTHDYSAALPSSLKKKTGKSNKKQTPPSQKK